MGSQSGGGESSQGAGTQTASLREFGRAIGVSDTAVRKGIKAGRLVKSLGKTPKGQPFIADVELAKREWTSTSRTSAGVRTTPVNGSQHGSQLAPSAPPPSPTRFEVRSKKPDVVEPTEFDDNGQGELIPKTTLIDAQTEATLERARKLKFENDVTEGRLIPVERVTKEGFEAERIIRENILNLPARIAGELAAESDAGRVSLLLETSLRAALNAAADGLNAEEALLAVNG